MEVKCLCGKTIEKSKVIAWIKEEEEKIAKARLEAVKTYGSLPDVPLQLIPSLKIGAGGMLKKLRERIEYD